MPVGTTIIAGEFFTTLKKEQTIQFRHSFDREDASSMVTAGATANTTEGNSCASRESGLLCSHSQGESIGFG